MIKTQKRIAYFKELGVKFMEEMPKGWKELPKGATTAPNGFKWIYNGKNPFREVSEYKSALLKI